MVFVSQQLGYQLHPSGDSQGISDLFIQHEKIIMTLSF